MNSLNKNFRIIGKVLSIFVTVFCLVLISSKANLPGSASAQDSKVYYVSPSGADSNSGTLSKPFQNIQKCASVATAGYTCLIQGGIYRETVIPANSGTAGKPITFKAYQNEQVTISGADPISNWTLHNHPSGKIYKATMNWDLGEGNNQVFVNDEMMVEARWPNINKNPAEITSKDKAIVDSGSINNPNAADNSRVSGTIVDEALSDFPTGFWNNAKVNHVPGPNWAPHTSTITSHTPKTINFSDYQYYANSLGYAPKTGNYYYIWGKYEALDAPKEWFKDASGNLYLWTIDGSNPASKLVEVKKRQWAFEINNKSNISIENINIFSAGIHLNNSSNISINKIKLLYGSNFAVIPHLWYDQGAPAILLGGNNNEVKNSEIRYAAGSGIRIEGDSSIITNSIIHDTNYSGTSSAIHIKGAGNTVMYNTLFDLGTPGAININELTQGKVMYNEAFNMGRQNSDGGTVQAWGHDGKGTEIAYNKIHDSQAEYNPSLHYFGSMGIYLDGNSSNYVVHHNVLWNIPKHGIAINSHGTPCLNTNRQVYNNTVDGEIWWEPSRSNMKGTILKNNIAKEFKDTQSAAGMTVENNIVMEKDAAGQITVPDVQFVNRSKHDYQLTATSPAVDKGAIASPYTNGFVGKQPDIGAFEYNKKPWTAGAAIAQEDLSVLK